ncbi:MAG: 1-acyl-sn-glycerol-3-phosphate acyltransferase [Oscillospiraceae bacterium]|nr:1-acyl-sn-glycerol-3-phosphate acyltransferase [Oscillospiraceae bacterium]
MLRSPNPVLWALLRPLLRLILRLKLHFQPRRARLNGPFVLLCNHASYYDPLLAAVCVDRPLCFAGADPAPRAGFLLSMARRLCQPEGLSWQDALNEAAVSGRCVGIFPEGRRCPDGVTGPIPAELAARIQASGLGLMVLRLEGAYLTAPRWAERIPRPGRLRARVMRTLTPGVLQAMETDELQTLLEQDLREDAFETVRRRPGPYRGEHTAERLEKLLCVCPKCGAVGTMESRDNEFFCRGCGFTTVYTLSGGFRGGNVPFENPGQWARWQRERIRLACEKAGDGPIFEDGGYEIYDLRHGGERIGTGGLHLYRDRLELPTGIAIPAADVVSLRLVGGSGLRLETRRGSRFELKTIRPVCAEKYLSALAILKEIRENAAAEEPEEAPQPESAETEETETADNTNNKEDTEEAEA